MLPVWSHVVLLALFSLTFWAAPMSSAQRRVFTNDDFPQAAPPPAPPAPAASEPEEAPAEAAPPADPVPFEIEKYPEPDENLSPQLRLSNFLQTTLRQSLREYNAQFEAETDPGRQQRLDTIMNLMMQLITFNQSFIAELEAQQKEAETETGAQAQAGAQPAP